MDGVQSKLRDTERALKTEEPMTRATKKKLRQTSWRARSTLNRCRDEQQALFENLRSCQDQILHLQEYALQQEAQTAWQDYRMLQPWYPAGPMSPLDGDFDSNYNGANHGGCTWLGAYPAGIPPSAYLDPETKPEDVWEWQTEDVGPHATIDPAVLSVDPCAYSYNHSPRASISSCHGLPTVESYVDEVGLTHYVYKSASEVATANPFPTGWDLAGPSERRKGARHWRSQSALLSPRSSVVAWQTQQNTDAGKLAGGGDGGRASPPPGTDGADGLQKRRYSAAAVDLILNRLKENEGKGPKKWRKGHGHSRSASTAASVAASTMEKIEDAVGTEG